MFMKKWLIRLLLFVGRILALNKFRDMLYFIFTANKRIEFDAGHLNKKVLQLVAASNKHAIDGISDIIKSRKHPSYSLYKMAKKSAEKPTVINTRDYAKMCHDSLGDYRYKNKMIITIVWLDKGGKVRHESEFIYFNSNVWKMMTMTSRHEVEAEEISDIIKAKTSSGKLIEVTIEKDGNKKRYYSIEKIKLEQPRL